MRKTLRTALLISVMTNAGCSLMHPLLPQYIPSSNIPKTSLTSSLGERRKQTLDDVADAVVKKGRYEHDKITFIRADQYDTVCQSMRLLPVEPKIRAGTKINIINQKRGMDYDFVTDMGGKIDLGTLVVNATGTRIEAIRQAIKAHLGQDTMVNLVQRESDPLPNYGQVYIENMVTGFSVQEPIAQRRFKALAAKYRLLDDSRFAFIYREHQDHCFVLVIPAEHPLPISTANIQVLHYDIILAGKPKEDLEEFRAALKALSLDLLGTAAAGSTAAKTLDQNYGYFQKPAEERR